nr:ImmA/IrrE family metallo-endopeptidase [Aurantimonas sp. CSK15Z-1]
MSRVDIEQKAYAWREALSVPVDRLTPDLLNILEHELPSIFPEFVLCIEGNSADGIEAYTQFDPPSITVRNLVYENAAVHDGRARMTLSHELGHLVLHKSAVPMHRAPVKYAQLQKLPIFASAEWQANTFASAFLMPDWLVKECSSDTEVSSCFKVSLSAARVRRQVLGLTDIRPMNQTVADDLRTLRGSASRF